MSAGRASMVPGMMLKNTLQVCLVSLKIWSLQVNVPSLISPASCFVSRCLAGPFLYLISLREANDTWKLGYEQSGPLSTYYRSFKSKRFPLSTRFRSLARMKVSPIVTQLVKGFMSENSQLARAPRSRVMTRSANALTWGSGVLR